MSKTHAFSSTMYDSDITELFCYQWSCEQYENLGKISNL